MNRTNTDSWIRLDHVSIQFRRQPVLHDVALAVERGETLVVIGESGCGKTVLLKLIIGLLRPTAGRVVFDGRNLSELGEKELAAQRMRFGYLFQGAALFDSMSVLENVAFPLREHSHLSDPEVHQTVRQLLQEVGLPPEVEAKMPAELSGGMRKRVGLARALAMKPEVMLYDEPTTGLDPIMSDVISELILQTRQRYPVTSIVVSHDMKTVSKVADQVVMLYPLDRLTPGEPQVLYNGPPEGLARASDPRVVQFVEGQAGERLNELAQQRVGAAGAVG